MAWFRRKGGLKKSALPFYMTICLVVNISKDPLKWDKHCVCCQELYAPDVRHVSGGDCDRKHTVNLLTWAPPPPPYRILGQVTWCTSVAVWLLLQLFFKWLMFYFLTTLQRFLESLNQWDRLISTAKPWEKWMIKPVKAWSEIKLHKQPFVE